MTKPNTKSSSSTLSQVRRPKAELSISKKSHPQLYKVSYNSDCSPYLILTLARKNAQKHPEVLSLFKNSNKNAPSLDDLAEEASTKLDQVSNKLKSVLIDLDNVNISPETSLNSDKEGREVSTDLSESLFKNFSTEELNLLLESLNCDSSEQTISGQQAIDDADIS